MLSQLSCEAIQESVNGKTAEIAPRLQNKKGKPLSKFTLYKMQEPSETFTDSGITNDVDRIIKLMQTSIDLGTPEEQALSPLHHMAAQFRRIVLDPLPLSAEPLSAIVHELTRTISEFSDLTKETAEAIDARGPGGERITQQEKRVVNKQGWEALRQIARIMTAVEQAEVL